MWSSPSLFAERRAVLESGCEMVGRDPASIQKSTQALFFVVDDEAKAASLAERVAPRPAVAGSYSRIAEMAAAYRDAGVDELIVPDFTLGTGAQKLEQLEGILTACRA
jgi:alkanesulfonate monooxygenase SsuD/methylene tetrahydromethanopterin reductase-like flavin-dependent oxidoreductase (luciferase family)